MVTKSSKSPYEVSIIPVLGVGNLKAMEVKCIAQRHTASIWQSWHQELSFQIQSPVFLLPGTLLLQRQGLSPGLTPRLRSRLSVINLKHRPHGSDSSGPQSLGEHSVSKDCQDKEAERG